MKLIEASELHILKTQMENLKFVYQSLSMCCNNMMQCRDESQQRALAAYKLSKFMFLDKSIEVLLGKQDTKIYFDVDGIILDWRKEILKHYPEFKNIDEFNKYPKKDQLILAAYEHDSDFFINIGFLTLAAQRIEALIKAGYDVHFLTATGTFGCVQKLQSDKLIVINRYLKELLAPDVYADFIGDGTIVDRVTFVLQSADKKTYAKPNTILVDDYDKNIKQWTEAGGIGILVDTERLDEEEAWGYYDRFTDGRLRTTEQRDTGWL